MQTLSATLINEQLMGFLDALLIAHPALQPPKGKAFPRPDIQLERNSIQLFLSVPR